MEDGIIYAVGTISSHQDVGFVPFFDKNIKELKAPLPLTIFDREWQKEGLEYHIQFKGSKSTDKTYKVLSWLSEWTQTRSKWTQNHRAFHLTLRDVYNKVIFAAKLLKHKENCDGIGDQYGFMTAFRYDIQVHHNTFLHRVHTTSGAAIQDIKIRQVSIVEVCYTTVRTNLETKSLHRRRLALDDQPRYGETSPTGQVTISQCQNRRRRYGVARISLGELRFGPALPTRSFQWQFHSRTDEHAPRLPLSAK
ncbi:hypothetical protein MJO29_010103 [Puccinia striiformis f. sp. tritici]|uniref:Uncharacterized protein n=1 Tax=Puccinia striiformis f. sp. tritici PST-78 TaxID=1165861 RepID=A0A0L0W2J1_9BASI|nr:hypothetical protein MJO29_010103 [Puccinia striiformis f. sp. tritici]KAI9615412.1 hypothetical protein H4Q26_011350 [Puccinia striiformis f. sp. tritici PST-130]KNF05697.1 hypothetical protein PSTG_01100 [Puccinia striiformis f. sp. tritici PST-78]